MTQFSLFPARPMRAPAARAWAWARAVAGAGARSVPGGLLRLGALAGAGVLAGCVLTLPRLPGSRPVQQATCVGNACPTAMVAGKDTPHPKARPAIGGAAAGAADAGRQAPAVATVPDTSAGLAGPTGPAAEITLGRTIASLGDVTQPGFWLRTPLVERRRAGRVVWAQGGNSVAVTLIPIPGDKGAGSRISLAAMKAMEIPLTALPELIVHARAAP